MTCTTVGVWDGINMAARKKKFWKFKDGKLKSYAKKTPETFPTQKAAMLARRDELNAEISRLEQVEDSLVDSIDDARDRADEQVSLFEDEAYAEVERLENIENDVSNSLRQLRITRNRINNKYRSW